jgi:3',5'-cyclic AMP phosphodiesterase CpdA
MSVLLQASDTHFGTERPRVVEALVELARAQQPEVVVLSGDITQRARRAQFAAARRFADRLRPAVILAVPGNHDIPLFNVAARLLAPYGGYASAFGDDLEPTYESDALLVVGVNTTRPWRHKHGEVSDEQIERVARRLRAQPPGKLRVVVTHQPVHVPQPRDLCNLLRGGERAAHAWASAGADIVMGGHIHLPYVRQVNERLPELPRPLWAVQAGTAVSRRVRRGGGEANSVNLVRYDGAAPARTCVVERWEHDAKLARFVRANEVCIALPG